MTDTEIINFISDNLVKVIPVLNTNGKVDFWLAGFCSVSKSGHNFINNDDFVKGTSFSEVIENLSKLRKTSTRKPRKSRKSHKQPDTQTPLVYAKSFPHYELDK